ADLPSGSGLGSSSSFAVGLLNALNAFRLRESTPADLAVAACAIEIDDLQKPIGKQDQFAAAFGGINYFRFDANERVSISPIVMDDDRIRELFSSLFLVWTGTIRSADTVLSDQRSRIDDNISLLDKMREMAGVGAEILSAKRLEIGDFGGLL